MEEEGKTITIVNHAKHQMTHADYELAQEEYRRKTLQREHSRTNSPARQSASLSAADMAEIRGLLARTDLSPADRAMLERRLASAQGPVGAGS